MADASVEVSGPLENRRNSGSAEKVARACDNCSRSKSKCLLRTGSRICENCKFLEVPCTFNRTVKKRGPPKGYVNTLEQRLSSLESIIRELRATGVVPPAPNDEATDDTISAEEPRTASNGSSAATANGKKRSADDEGLDESRAQKRPSANGSGQHRDMYLQSTIRSPSSQDPTTEKSTVLGYLSIDENMTMRYHGPTSGLYLMTRSRVFASPFWQFSNPGFWPPSKRPTFRTEDEIVNAADAIVGGILPSLSVQNKLLDAYWTYVHPYFPVIHKETFLFQLSKDRRRIPRAGRSALDQLERRIPQVLLLAMFAVAARFVDNPEGQRDDGDPGDEYATKAETLIAQHKQSSINCCLALLMMAYREIGTGGSISWMYVGNAVRMAQDLGFHRDPSVWKRTSCFRNMSSVEIQIRRLIWWGIFVLDRYISAWQGRPCAIHEDDFDTQLPDEAPQGVRDISLSCFIQTIRLSIIQGRIHKAFYSVGAEPQWDRLYEFEQALDEWEAQVPDFLAVRQGSRLPVSVIMLHAQFWNCKILLHRPFISPTRTRSTNPSLLAVTSAAVAIANLLEHFTSSYSANFAPPFLNYYAFTATIAHLFNRAMCPLLFSPSALIHCTECCRKMSQIWSSAMRTLHIIEGVDHDIQNLLPTMTPSGAPTAATSATTASSSSVSTSAYPGLPAAGLPPDAEANTQVEGEDFCFTSWPSPILDPDWLSLETWRGPEGGEQRDPPQW